MTTIRLKAWGFIGLIPAVFGLFVLYDANASSGQRFDPIEFTFRPYEKSRDEAGGHTFVIYADPECPACRNLARDEMNVQRSDVEFLYRWYLLAPTSGRTLRAAIAIEAVNRTSIEKGTALRRAIFATDEKLTDDVILNISAEVGVRDTVVASLQAPPDDILSWISSDGKAFERAGHFAVPQPARLDKQTMTLALFDPGVIKNFLTDAIESSGNRPASGVNQK